MKSVNILATITLVVLLTSCSMQIKNARTETLKINGNCAMCKSFIEEAGNVNKVALVEWNKDTKMATMTYDSTITNQKEILKRIALAGYDSDQYLAPDDVYASLPDCCKYNRVNKAKTAIADTEPNQTMQHSDTMNGNHGEPKHDPQHNTQHDSTHDTMHDTNLGSKQDKQLNKVFENYFGIKDALVNSDAALTSKSASLLINAIKAVQMNKLSSKEHTAWMKVMDELEKDAQQIVDSKDIAAQRDHFMTLSENTYQLMKASGYNATVYYQHCPMANEGNGANWLSKEKGIKNPFYGASMLTCGKTVETIK